MSKTIFASAEATIKVPFHDVDAAEIAWHGHYTKYFEIARCQVLDKIDYNYAQMKESGYFWPVIDLRIRYINPLRFRQYATVKASIVEWEHRLKIEYLVSDPETGARLTKGYTSQVAVNISDGEMLLASPPVLAQKLGIEDNLK